ncbi:hypothetical protein [Terriglobus tenax]|uniref:hypothetical protein n=1 Tax=Terriglobus tenax TaxID=1111115 RepID=UPI0021E0B577|nr:hypothetical protein [Terriglobus tenax]
MPKMRSLRPAFLLLLTGLAAPIARAADSPFIGQWRLNPSRSKLTDVMKVEAIDARRYTVNFGSGAENVTLDGTDQPGNFGSTLSLTRLAADSLKVVRKKNGRITLIAVWTLSNDARILTDHFTGYKPDGSTYELDYRYTRKGSGTGFAGEWVSISEALNSSVSMQVTAYQEDGLAFSDSSTQTTRAAKFDDKDYPNLGPNAIPESTSSLRRVDERTLELTFKVEGRLIYKQQIQLSPDLRTMTLTRHIAGETETNIQVFEKI